MVKTSRAHIASEHGHKGSVVNTHQLDKHDEHKWRGDDGRRENAVLVKVRLPGKLLVMLPQECVDVLSHVYNASCRKARNTGSEHRRINTNLLRFTAQQSSRIYPQIDSYRCTCFFTMLSNAHPTSVMFRFVKTA
jgi:hypothetical protein